MRRNRVFAAMLAVLMVVSLTACGRESVGTPGGELENGVAAIEDAMTTKPNESSSASTTPIDDLRNGSSTDTVATPGDFPDAYNYGSGKISDYSRTAMLQKMPEPAGNNTVLNTAADSANIQVLYLWEEGNVPARTKFTQDMTGYFDDWNFRPYVTAIPVRDGVKPKGAVVLMAGGAYQFRGQLHRFAAHRRSTARAGLSDLHRRLPPVSLYAGGRCAGCGESRPLCPQKCGGLWY